MTTTREILNRAARRKMLWEVPVPPAETVLPTQTRTAVPQPIRQNSVYRRLMKSHDRVRTRHLEG